MPIAAIIHLEVWNARKGHHETACGKSQRGFNTANGEAITVYFTMATCDACTEARFATLVSK